MTGLRKVHFADLADYAERGKIERGVRYIHCHTGHFDSYCYEELALTPVVMRRRDHDMPPRDRYEDPWWEVEMPFFQAMHRSHVWPGGWFREWHYASDSGMWDVPGIEYKNTSNYLLNVNALLRQGIVIDMEKRGRQ